MRFISPSFNHQGWTKSFDLNSVAYGTSPAFTLHAEHPTGEQYARYLSALAEEGGLRVRTCTEVTPRVYYWREFDSNTHERLLRDVRHSKKRNDSD